MKRSIIIFLSLALAAVGVLQSAENRSGRVNWMTNYDEAVKVSRSTSKPMLLLFTGSDWCTWCIKLEKEVFNTQEFADAAGDKFVFVKIDFPVNKASPPDVSAQNKRLQKSFGVEGFPSVILLDAHQKTIGTTGYRAGGGKQYAQYLFKMLDDNAVYKQKVSVLDKQQLNSTDLKQLYERALALKEEGDLNRIVTAGLNSEHQQFFLIEKYRQLAGQGKLHTSDAIALKQQVVDSNPQNAKQVYYQMAMIDFEAFCREMHEGFLPPEEAVAPLVAYIKQFGDSDKANLWRLDMLVAQTYYEKDKIPEALEFAESSYNAAPTSAQPEIALAIKNMRLSH